MNAAESSALRYRPDIDGLRAVAILLVILFHAGVGFFSGGYVGVDIFFVISGYLITGIVSRDIDGGRFRISTFYERRVRRIAPALLAVIAVCCVACYMLFLPTDLVQYAHSVFAALFSYSNFYFWTQADYFKQTYVKVLLHTWSLAVEEQFYLFLPFTLLLLKRRPRWIGPFFWCACICSFGVSEWLVLTHRATTAFFMPFSRAWELMLGSMLALDLLLMPQSRIGRELLAFTGGILILVATCGLKDRTPFPGASALLPCLGALFLLGTGGSGTTVCSRLLSWKPVVAIGLISYSVYLWHWPLLIFARLGCIPHVNDKGPFQKLILLSLSLLIGWASWLWIEQPFRTKRSGGLSTRAVFAVLGTGAACLLVVGSVYISKAGLPYRFPAATAGLDSYLNGQEILRTGSCFITSGTRFSDFKPDQCLTLDSRRKNYLLFGDSHAAALWFGLESSLSSAHILEATTSGCAPLLGGYDQTDCGKMRKLVYETVLPNTRVDGVILTERWENLADVEQIRPAIIWLQQRGIPVIVVGPVQEYDAPLPMLLALATKWRNPQLPDTHLLPSTANLDNALRFEIENWHVVYLSPWKVFCTPGHCLEYANRRDGVPTLSDTNHLTSDAAVMLGRRWEQSGVFN